MDRRTFIRRGGTLSVPIVATLAGCSDQGSNDNQGSDGGSGNTQDSGEDPSEPPSNESNESNESTSDGNESDDQGNLTVDMVTNGEDYYFDPIGLHIESGMMITFRNESGSHSSTAYEESNPSAEETRIPDGADTWDSGTLNEEGATFEHIFETTGTYDYFCLPHKSLEMVGRIIVDEPGGPAEEGMPPDGDVPESQMIIDEGSVAYNEFNI
ncbi:plastocyanin/azurin family copper-binding protein [Halalkalicoccus sp. GCM10025322]|uniref:plastocyanin/azurin family copper-binding protein n=2 Tax=Halococcaceae TaxID=1963270 RepID=UPI002F965875